MFAEFINTLRKLRGSILGWGIGLFLYDLLIASMYSSIIEMGDSLQAMLSSYPEEMLAFFPSIAEFTSPVGFMDTYFSAYMTFIIGIFAAGAAGRLVVGEEESGILDLVMSYPVSRTKLFFGRFLAYLSALAIILLACWLGWVIPAESAGIPLTAFEMLLPILPLFAVLFVFGGLGLLLSLVMPSSKLAGGLAGGLLVGNFLLVGLSNLNEDLQPFFEVTPLYFYQGAKIIEDPNWGWMLGLIGVGLIFVAAAWLIFLRRDIRVGGEAGWQLPLLSLRKTAE